MQRVDSITTNGIARSQRKTSTTGPAKAKAMLPRKMSSVRVSRMQKRGQGSERSFIMTNIHRNGKAASVYVTNVRHAAAAMPTPMLPSLPALYRPCTAQQARSAQLPLPGSGSLQPTRCRPHPLPVPRCLRSLAQAPRPSRFRIVPAIRYTPLSRPNRRSRPTILRPAIVETLDTLPQSRPALRERQVA